MKAFFNWSGGKDSALALWACKAAGIPVDLLVTTVSAATQRVSMHGVQQALLGQQAAALGLPLRVVTLPEMPGMQAYEHTVRAAHRQLAAEGYTEAVFGDIFLEDLKAYREELLLQDGLACRFPLWKEDTTALLRRFIAEGFKAVVVCVNAALLGEGFCGRELDESFLTDLPVGVDPCGERGEFHSFVYDGPGFAHSVSFERGGRLYKEYPAPATDDCFATRQPAAGFWFQELLPTAPLR